MRKQHRKPLVLTAITLAFVLLLTSSASALTTYTVQSGDWLSKIAPKFGLTWEALYDANRDTVKDPNLIYVGQQLTIPDTEDFSAALTQLAMLVPTDEIAGIPAVLTGDTVLADTLLAAMTAAGGTDLAALPVPLGIATTGYAGVLDLYGSTRLVTLTVTGKELKGLLEAAVSAYATWKPGDVTIAFSASGNQQVCLYAGTAYSVDLSQPAGSRIVNPTFGGKALTDDQTLTLSASEAQATAWKTAGLISGVSAVKDSAKSLRSLLAANLPTVAAGTATDGNWKIIGANLDHPLRDEIVALVKAGTVKLTASGTTPNVKALNVHALIASGALAGYDVIDLFHTNDTHGRIKAGDGMGFATIDTLVSSYKTANPNALLLDIGDTFHGVNFVTLTQGKTAADAMNLMGYDAMAPGNHDFNYGQARLTELDSLTDFPVLAANVKKADGTPYLTPWVVKTVDGVRIALIGLATPETLYKTNPLNVTGLTFEDPVVAAKAAIASLAGKADVFVALAHLGIEGDDISRKLAQAVPELDVILDGHSHSELDETVNGVHISQSGYYDKVMGITTLVMKNGVFDQAGSALVSMADTVNVIPSADVTTLLDTADAQVEALTSVVIGTSPVELDGVRGNVRTKPTNLANLITAAMLDKTGADVAITNGGGIRASISAGAVTKGDVLTVLPFGNYVVVKELKGADIIAALELGFSIYPEALGGYSQTAGLTIRFDSSKAKGSRIVEVLVGGVALDPAKTYTVATNDFMAVGGDNYTMLKHGPTTGEFPALDEIVIEYIQNKGFGAAVEDNRVTDIAAPAATSALDPAA